MNPINAACAEPEICMQKIQSGTSVAVVVIP
jgi:hypothetical protein